jgi:hypothetical protein
VAGKQGTDTSIRHGIRRVAWVRKIKCFQKFERKLFGKSEHETGRIPMQKQSVKVLRISRRSEVK